jgi:hypothetical protein
MIRPCADAAAVRRGQDPAMEFGAGQRSYAVTWVVGSGPVRVGKLELSPNGLRLEGGDPKGRLFSLSLLYRDLGGVHIARSAVERIRRLPTVVVNRPGRAAVRIATVGGLGMTTEVFERLVPLIAAAT